MHRPGFDPQKILVLALPARRDTVPAASDNLWTSNAHFRHHISEPPTPYRYVNHRARYSRASQAQCQRPYNNSHTFQRAQSAILHLQAKTLKRTHGRTHRRSGGPARRKPHKACAHKLPARPCCARAAPKLDDTTVPMQRRRSTA